jgi:hypothetical protein
MPVVTLLPEDNVREGFIDPPEFARLLLSILTTFPPLGADFLTSIPPWEREFLTTFPPGVT